MSTLIRCERPPPGTQTSVYYRHFSGGIFVKEVTDGNTSTSPGEQHAVRNLEELYSAVAETAKTVGIHPVISSSLSFGDVPVDEIVRMLPSLRWTLNLTLYGVHGG